MTEKMTQKVSPSGKITIPKGWREKLAINEGEVELELNEENTILIKKKIHPLEIDDALFKGVSPFMQEELDEVKKSLFSIKRDID